MTCGNIIIICDYYYGMAIKYKCFGFSLLVLLSTAGEVLPWGAAPLRVDAARYSHTAWPHSGTSSPAKSHPTDCLRCAFAVRITVCRLSTMPQKNARQCIHNHIHLDSAQHSTQPDYVYTISLYMQHYFVILLLFMIHDRIDHAPVNLIIGAGAG